MGMESGYVRRPLGEANEMNTTTGPGSEVELESWKTCVRYPPVIGAPALSSSKPSSGKIKSEFREWFSSRVRGRRARNHGLESFTGSKAMRKGSAVSSVLSSQGSFTKPFPNEVCRAPCPSRAIQLDVPTTISLTTVLSQVCGGPLERVVTSSSNTRVIVEFMHLKHAQHFFRYAKTGRFVVAGRKISCRYVDFPLVSPMSLSPTSPRSSNAGEKSRLRRILRVYRHYFGAEFDDESLRLDPLMMKSLFETISPVLQLQPMLVGHAVSYAVHFDSVAAASKVKALFDDKSSIFACLSSWKVEYFQDSTERPCVML